jgi:hypothetical protein
MVRKSLEDPSGWLERCHMDHWMGGLKLKFQQSQIRPLKSPFSTRVLSRLFMPNPHHSCAFGFQKLQKTMRKLVGRLSGFRHFFKIFIYKLGGIPPRYILLNCLLKKFWFFDQISVAKSSLKIANTLFFWNSRTTFCRWFLRYLIRILVVLLNKTKFLPHRRKIWQCIAWQVITLSYRLKSTQGPMAKPWSL